MADSFKAVGIWIQSGLGSAEGGSDDVCCGLWGKLGSGCAVGGHVLMRKLRTPQHWGVAAHNVEEFLPQAQTGRTNSRNRTFFAGLLHLSPRYFGTWPIKGAIMTPSLLPCRGADSPALSLTPGSGPRRPIKFGGGIQDFPLLEDGPT